jgi:hypothetical protein
MRFFLILFQSTGCPGLVLHVMRDFYTANNNRRKAGEGACGWWSPSGLVRAVDFFSWLINSRFPLRQAQDWRNGGAK